MRSSKRQSKDKSMIRHCQKRFRERFGTELTQNMMENMLAQIRKNKSKYVDTQSVSRVVHTVTLELNGEPTEIAVIYNKNKKLIHTLFPASWLTDGTYEEYQRRRAYINGEDLEEID